MWRRAILRASMLAPAGLGEALQFVDSSQENRQMRRHPALQLLARNLALPPALHDRIARAFRVIARRLDLGNMQADEVFHCVATSAAFSASSARLAAWSASRVSS